MNYWTQLSTDYANQKSYLDDLFQIYPTIPEGIRDINEDSWRKIEDAFNKKSNEVLIKELLKLNLFPIKDSYIVYLKRDKTSIEQNPKTINRICGHQNAQFNDAISTVKAKNVRAIKIAILDGVLYIKGNNKMYKDITTKYKDLNIMSSLVLREFLYQI